MEFDYYLYILEDEYDWSVGASSLVPMRVSELPAGTRVVLEGCKLKSCRMFVRLGSITVIKDSNLTSCTIVTKTSTNIVRNGSVTNALLMDATLTNNNVIGEQTQGGESSEVTKDNTIQIGLGSESSGCRYLQIPPSHVLDIPTVYTAMLKCDASSTPIPCTGAPSLPNLPPSNTYGVVLMPNSKISNTVSPITSTYLHPSSTIQSSSCTETVLLPHATVSNGCTVRYSYVMEHTEIGDNALVSNCVVGPDSVLACGESHNSLLGPCTVSHHQSLLISHISPFGRTNTGYGANCGSNHTGRLPDAEMWNGEGVFIGLSTIIKLSVDVSSSHYSLIAAGTSVESGVKVECPFSLITDGRGGKGGKNIVRPGWVLYSTQYTVARAWDKFKNRVKATRHKWYSGTEVMRCGVLEVMRRELERGVGKGCVGVEIVKAERGARAYRDMLKMVALEGLMKKVEGGMRWDRIGLGGARNPLEGIGDVMPWMEPKDPWEYHKFLLSTFYPGPSDFASMMQELLFLHGDFVEGVEKSKAKDDRKGRHIKGYEKVHPKAKTDKVVRKWKDRDKEIGRRVKEVLRFSSAKL